MSGQSSLRRLILDNAVWMVGSIFLAVIIWFAAENQQNPVQQNSFRDSIPVQVLKDPTMLVVNPPPPVRVVVRAPLSVWNLLQDSDITVTADLRGQPAGTHVVTLTATLSQQRLGAVSAVLPSQVTIDLAQRSEQAFNINITQTASPPVGFEMTSATPHDQTAKVSGSADQVKLVASVIAPVDLSTETKPLTRTLPLEAVDAAGNPVLNVDVTPSQVTVDINIQPRPGVVVLKIQPTLLTATLPQGYLLSVASSNPVSVAVRGDPSTIEALNGVVATEQIDLTGKTQSFTQTVKLALPPGVSLTDPVDVVVSVTIQVINITRQFSNIPVQPQGLDSADFSITLQPDTVNVIVTGPQSALETLQQGDIQVIAPLSGLAGGTHTVILQASVAHAGLTSQNLSIPDGQVQVTIVALHPTATPTPSPTSPPTITPTITPTGSVTP